MMMLSMNVLDDDRIVGLLGYRDDGIAQQKWTGRVEKITQHKQMCPGYHPLAPCSPVPTKCRLPDDKLRARRNELVCRTFLMSGIFGAKR